MYIQWALDQKRNDGNGKMSSPTRGLVAPWVKESWEKLSKDVTRKCFKLCGLTLNLDGSGDHAWCENTFGINYRELLAEQREVWQNAHVHQLPPLKLPDIPGAAMTLVTPFLLQLTYSRLT